MGLFPRVGDWDESRLASWIRLTFPQLSAKTVPPTAGGGGSGRLPGELTMWPTTSPPVGHVLCDGSEYDPGLEDYAALYAVIGTQFNTGGETAGFFRVPDMKGRVPVGPGANADVAALGDSDGLAEADRSPKHAHLTEEGETTGDPHSVALGAPTIKDGSGSTVVTPWQDYYQHHTHTTPAVATDAQGPAYMTVCFIIAL